MENDKIIHFTDEFNMNDIETYLSENTDIIYYTRFISKSDELHIVNHNNGKFKLLPFIKELFNHYIKNLEIKEEISTAKIKGNSNFVIISNVGSGLIEKIKNDVAKLLIK